MAGLNYKFIVQMDDEYREIVVWKKLDGKF